MPTRCASLVAERVQQADGVTRHVTEVVLARVVAAAQNRHRIRRRIVHVGRPADVAVVESGDSIAAPGQRGDEIQWPRVQLLSQTGDEHDRRIVRVADLVVAQFDTAADVDDHLLGVMPTPAAAPLRVSISNPAFRRYTTARPPRPGAVATPRE